MSKAPRSVECTNSGHLMPPDCADPLRDVVLLAVERVGLRLPTWDHAREVAIVHTSGVVERWLCSSETRWSRNQPGREATPSAFGHRRVDPEPGWGLDPAEVAAGLRPVLEQARLVAALEAPEAVAWWLTTLYNWVGETVPCRVVALDELYCELLPGIERLRIVSNARHLAALLHHDAPNIVLEATRAIESLRQIAYRLEIGQAVASAQGLARGS